MNHGATLLVSYTWSHDLDEVSDSNNGAVMNAYNLNQDYASSNWDIRHRFVMNYNYALPFFLHSPSALARYTLGGWQVNGVTTIQSGYPFSVAIASDIANTSPGGRKGLVLWARRPPIARRSIRIALRVIS